MQIITSKLNLKIPLSDNWNNNPRFSCALRSASVCLNKIDFFGLRWSIRELFGFAYQIQMFEHSMRYLVEREPTDSKTQIV